VLYVHSTDSVSDWKTETTNNISTQHIQHKLNKCISSNRHIYDRRFCYHWFCFPVMSSSEPNPNRSDWLFQNQYTYSHDKFCFFRVCMYRSFDNRNSVWI